MSSTLIKIAQIDASAVTRPRDAARVAFAVTAAEYGATTGTGFGTEGTAVSTGTWTLAIRKPMSDVDFHDRWPLRSTL